MNNMKTSQYLTIRAQWLAAVERFKAAAPWAWAAPEEYLYERSLFDAACQAYDLATESHALALRFNGLA